jgi:hypothetical protein
MMGFKQFHGGRGGAAEKVRFGEFHITLPKKMPSCSRVKLYFDADERRAAFQPSEDEGFSVSSNRQVSSRSFRKNYAIPTGTAVNAEWDDGKGMLITEPIPTED